MYNEHFQTGQQSNTSGYVNDSYSRPSPFRLEPIRTSNDPQVISPANAIIVQKIEALFPILEQMAGQNDVRANQIISKLMGLKEDLDSVYGEG
jgi:hypothetical protein